MGVRKMATSGIVIENPKTGVNTDFTPPEPSLTPSSHGVIRFEYLPRGRIKIFDGKEVVLTNDKTYQVEALNQDGRPTRLLKVNGYGDGKTIYLLPLGIEPYSVSTKPGNKSVDDGVWATRLENKPSSYYR